MTHVESFDSMDEAFAWMAANEDMANAHLTPGQVRLRDDVENTVYWVRAAPEMDLVEYGIVAPIEEIRGQVGFDVVDNRERGYLTGTAYSALSESGEWGDTHVYNVIPITGTVFLLAKSLGWPTYSMLREPDNRTLAALLAAAERDALGR